MKLAGWRHMGQRFVLPDSTTSTDLLVGSRHCFMHCEGEVNDEKGNQCGAYSNAKYVAAAGC